MSSVFDNSKPAEETRQVREQRYAADYAVYVDACKKDGIESLNYMNWAHNKKIEEKNAGS